MCQYIGPITGTGRQSYKKMATPIQTMWLECKEGHFLQRSSCHQPRYQQNYWQHAQYWSIRGSYLKQGLGYKISQKMNIMSQNHPWKKSLRWYIALILSHTKNEKTSGLIKGKNKTNVYQLMFCHLNELAFRTVITSFHKNQRCRENSTSVPSYPQSVLCSFLIGNFYYLSTYQ